MQTPYFRSRVKFYFILLISLAIITTTICWSFSLSYLDSRPIHKDTLDSAAPQRSIIESFSEYFSLYPLNGPNYKSQFAEQGKRLQLIKEWIKLEDGKNDASFFENVIEKATSSMFPFIQSISYHSTPLMELRKLHVPESKGIVITAGKSNFRYAIHLAVSIREVLECTLPIRIAFAGSRDLPFEIHEIFLSVAEDVRFLDIKHYLSGEGLDLNKAGRSVKAFSALLSPFQHTLLVDSDIVFLQSPEVLFNLHGYTNTGALFFHDQLIPRKNDDRKKWWHSQIPYPSTELNKTIPWHEDFSEQANSGVMVLDKSRLSTIIGLLHTCWQNTDKVRNEVTYKLGDGEKESWWMGFELSNSSYAFQKSYGGAIGRSKGDSVCGYKTVQLDDDNNLLWYNGGLLKNKYADSEMFEAPTHWMIDGDLEDKNKGDLNCMKNSKIREISEKELDIIKRCIDLAKKYDDLEGLLKTS